MNMDSLKQNWENILKEAGMPAEIESEEEKIIKAGYEPVSGDYENDEAKAFKKKLKMEDDRNEFGGFPSTTEIMVSMVETLREEWMAQNIPAKNIKIAVHSSCVNGNDCVILYYNDSHRYHYNTKDIIRYSREKLTSKLKSDGLEVIEK